MSDTHSHSEASEVMPRMSYNSIRSRGEQEVARGDEAKEDRDAF